MDYTDIVTEAADLLEAIHSDLTYEETIPYREQLDGLLAALDPDAALAVLDDALELVEDRDGSRVYEDRINNFLDDGVY